jgi:hypothetical protein
MTTYSELEMMIEPPHLGGLPRWAWKIYKTTGGGRELVAGGYGEDQEDAFKKARKAREFIVNSSTGRLPER